MKTYPYVSSVICTSMLLSACAQFQHQTREDEPHAVVVIARASNSVPLSGEVKTMDGQPVREGASYRVRPGGHELVMEVVEREIESANPVSATLYHAGNAPPVMEQPGNLHISESGAMTTSGVNPYQSVQTVSMSVEKRSIRHQTLNFTAVAGRNYEVNGMMLSEGSLSRR